jgi:diguanylate cyclase (GGDEF)-like protein/PAS domain S-box-containing protein
MGVYFVDTNMKVRCWNKAAHALTGYGSDELIGKSCKGNLLCHIEKVSEPLCAEHCPLLATIKDGASREALAFVRNKSGERIPVKAETRPVYHNSQIAGALAILNRAEVERKEVLVDSLTKLALTDRLTGLHNRGFLQGEINVKLAEMKQTKSQYGILFMDIDNFSKFNNTYGHEVGDMVLIELARTIEKTMQKTDSFCRWGGEEFVGLFQIGSFGELTAYGDMIINAIRGIRLNFKNTELSITASIGITGAVSGDTAETAVKRADDLMYESKKSGKDRYTIG